MDREQREKVFPGADEKTPSRAQYFSWINNTNEGSTEEQTMINLDFFAWLQQEYGMKLDIYAWDAGNLDGAGYYGSIDSEKFKSQFPNGFKPIYEKAKALGIRLGIWGGADGFGDTPEEEEARIRTIVDFCRKYEFMLFKFDTVCGTLRPEKQDSFIKMMRECRKYCPDLIVLNHRNDLGKAAPYSTTFLWEGAETYIDVHMSNRVTAPHHRAGALSRGLVPDLKRLTEDHGVCLSSCLDYWDDDLVLQAFNRCLILAPEIYGNPWLLRDDEFPKLARIYNLHRRYRDILVNGMVLPEESYGPHAVSRGDEATRFITLRNLSWQKTVYQVALDESIGLKAGKCVELRQLHPTEKVLGRFRFGEKVAVEVFPFRSCLLMASTKPIGEIGMEGCDYEVIKDLPGQPAKIVLLGFPGTGARVKLTGAAGSYSRARLDGEDVSGLLKGQEIDIRFPGNPIGEDFHRKLGDLRKTDVPPEAEALYEATCFAADSNALEVRSLFRSGPTAVPQAARARDVFFSQKTFIYRGTWDRYMFDGNPDTFFDALSLYMNLRVNGGVLRVDLGKPVSVDEIEITRLEVEEDIREAIKTEPPVSGDVSADLHLWTPVTQAQVKTLAEYVAIPVVTHKSHILRMVKGSLKRLTYKVQTDGEIRYFRLPEPPDRIVEFKAYKDGRELDRTGWRASNLLGSYGKAPAIAAWSGSFIVERIPANSYLCVAVNGKHGVEKAYCAARIGGRLIGAPDRSPSYPSNVWEWVVRPSGQNYTYYIPLTPDMAGEKIEIFTLLLEGGNPEITPEVWLAAYPVPFVKKELTLE